MRLFKSRKEKQMERDEQKRMEEEIRIKEYELSLNRTKEIAQKYLLTTSAEAYVSSVGRNLTDFYLRSVYGACVGHIHSLGGDLDLELEETILKCKMLMIEKAKGLGAEVVIDTKQILAFSDVRLSPAISLAYIIGTALIPK